MRAKQNASETNSRLTNERIVSNWFDDACNLQSDILLRDSDSAISLSSCPLYGDSDG